MKKTIKNAQFFFALIAIVTANIATQKSYADGGRAAAALGGLAIGTTIGALATQRDYDRDYYYGRDYYGPNYRRGYYDRDYDYHRNYYGKRGYRYHSRYWR